MLSVSRSSTSSASAPGSGAAPIDARRVVTRLAGAVFGAMVLSAGALAVLIVATRHSQWWGAWAAAVAVSTVAAVLSLGPVIPGLFAGAQYVAVGYLAGMVLRMLIALGGGFAAVFVVRTPPGPTLLMLIPLYFAQIVAEAVILSRAIWLRV